VRAAMDHATRYFAQLDEVAFAVGQRLHEITGAEWGMVSSGCAGVTTIAERPRHANSLVSHTSLQVN